MVSAGKSKGATVPKVETTPPKVMKKALSSRPKPKLKPKAKVVEESEYEPEGKFSVLFLSPSLIADHSFFFFFFFLNFQNAHLFMVPKMRLLKWLILKRKGWKSKHRSMRKSTAAAKEAKEAKEAAAAVAAASKATPGWATTFTLGGVQYILKDAAGHPVSSLF